MPTTFRKCQVVCIALVLNLAFSVTVNARSAIEQTVLNDLDNIRSIIVTTDENLIDEHNKVMDDTWKYFSNNKKEVIPILIDQIQLEIAKSSPSDLMLLDAGYFLFLNGNDDAKVHAKNALFALDPQSDIILAFYQQLFYFTHAVSSASYPGALDFIDRAFLPNSKKSIFVPQHSLRLDPTLLCVFLYGVHGPQSEKHLRELLSTDTREAVRILEVLIWLGSDKSVEAVGEEMVAHPNHQIFSRALTFMMKIGGPKGRSTMLGIDEKMFDAESQSYYRSTLEGINAVSYDYHYGRLQRYSESLSDSAEEKNLKQMDIKTQLVKIFENHGRDIEYYSLLILDSDLPKKYLIKKLTKIRSRVFYRISDEALDTVNITNAIINALQFRSY